MAGIPENKTRITITLGKGVLANLDEYCDETGLTRSAAIGSMVAEQLSTRKRLVGTLEQTFSPEALAAMLKSAG